MNLNEYIQDMKNVLYDTKNDIFYGEKWIINRWIRYKSRPY